jgi:hypothetical protein
MVNFKTSVFLFCSATFFLSHLNCGWAAPCCSSNSAAPSIITGDDKAQVSFDLNGGYIVGDVSAHGPAIFRDDNNEEVESGMTINAAHLLTDRFQWGGSVPLRHRSHEQGSQSESASGFGDMRLNLAYEILPEWNYSVWIPRAYIFFQEVFPTGRSIYDSNNSIAVDAFGKGFFTSGLGMIFLKTYQSVDLSWLSSLQYSVPRKFHEIEVSPGFGVQGAFGVGFSPRRSIFRLGFRWGPNYQQPKISHSAMGEIKSSYQLSWDTGFDVGMTLSRVSSITASYTDQTLMGPAKNTSLSRTAALSFQYRWER